MLTDCPFCRIASGAVPALLIAEWPETVAIVPLQPVVDGHLIVFPRFHVRDAASSPLITGMTAARAAELGARTALAFNLIASVGAEATQTIPHLHWHFVPRSAGDGLALPWTGQQ